MITIAVIIVVLLVMLVLAVLAIAPCMLSSIISHRKGGE